MNFTHTLQKVLYVTYITGFSSREAQIIRRSSRYKLAQRKHRDFKLFLMEDQIASKQFLARKRVRTIPEWDEDGVNNRKSDTTVSKTHQCTSSSRGLLGNERQDSQAQSYATEANVRRRRFKFAGVLNRVYSECSASESPLKGTPWEDAGWNSTASQKNRRHLGRQRNAKEEQSIDFWLKFFG